MRFFIKKLLPKLWLSSGGLSFFKNSDSAIFQNLRETVERDEEIINVSFCYRFCNSFLQRFFFAINYNYATITFLAFATKNICHWTSYTKWLCFICKFHSCLWVMLYDSYSMTLYDSFTMTHYFPTPFDCWKVFDCNKGITCGDKPPTKKRLFIWVSIW